MYLYRCMFLLASLTLYNRSIVDSDTVSTYQVSSVQLVANKKLEAFHRLQFANCIASLLHYSKIYCCNTNIPVGL